MKRFVLHTQADAGKTCANCGTTFRKDPRNTWKYWARAKYCSQACAGLAWKKRAAEHHLTLRETFERYVIKNADGCWGWTGLTNKRRGGYPVFPYEGKMLYGHVVALELDGRPVPTGMYGCHRCDNPICTRTDHLYVGTPEQNMQDAKDRGRLHVGSDHYAAKLTEDTVRFIRQSAATDVALADQYGVSRAAISMARSRKTWRHVQ